MSHFLDGGGREPSSQLDFDPYNQNCADILKAAQDKRKLDEELSALWASNLTMQEKLQRTFQLVPENEITEFLANLESKIVRR